MGQMSARAASNQGVTEHEGMLLALVFREQPITAYQLFKIFEESPVSSINTSKGQIYPAMRRLKSRKLVRAQKVTTASSSPAVTSSIVALV